MPKSHIRSTAVNNALYNTLAVAGVQQVVPGSTFAELSNMINFETEPLTTNCLTSVRAEVMWYYVPYRLVWDEFVDFITADTADNAPAMPTTTTQWPTALERLSSSTSIHTLNRRALKLIYNQFFADARASGFAPLVDITDDADLPTMPVRSLEQTASALSTADDAIDPEYEIDTSGASTGIPLNDFRAQMANARSARGRALTGDKYVDAMRRVGVSLDWRVQNAPEFLGKGATEVYPQRTPDTSSEEQGRNVARYAGSVKCSFSRKRFAEHGVVMAVYVLRPRFFVMGSSQPMASCFTEFDQWWRGDNAVGYFEKNATVYGVRGGSPDPALGMRAFDWLRRGQHLLGNVGATTDPTEFEVWAMLHDPQTEQELVYPRTTSSASLDIIRYDVSFASNWEIGLIHPIKSTF